MERFLPAGPPLVPVPSPFDVVVVAASLGGVAALTTLLGALPAAFAVPLLVVQHLSPDGRSQLAELLDSRTTLSVRWAAPGERLHPGTVAVARPGRHLRLTAAGTLALGDDAKVAFSRPSADVLFTSVAAVSKQRAIGVVLTGYGHDGAAGAARIKQAGGRVLVQDPATSEGSPMPAAAIATRSVDFVLPLERLAAALISLCMVPGAAELFAVPPMATAHLPRPS